MCQWETTECHCCSCHNAHTLRPFRTGFVDNFCWLCAGSFIRRLRCCSAGRSARAHTATWDLLNKLNLELAEHTTFELIPGQLALISVWESLEFDIPFWVYDLAGQCLSILCVPADGVEDKSLYWLESPHVSVLHWYIVQLATTSTRWILTPF